MGNRNDNLHKSQSAAPTIENGYAMTKGECEMYMHISIDHTFIHSQEINNRITSQGLRFILYFKSLLEPKLTISSKSAIASVKVNAWH